MSIENPANKVPNPSPIFRTGSLENRQGNDKNSAKSALSFFTAKSTNNDEKIYPTRGGFFSAFITHTLQKLFEDTWQRESTQKLIKDCGLNIQASIDFSNTYQGSTAQDFSIFLFEILGLKDLPKNVTLNTASIELQAALEKGITKEQAHSFMQDNNASNVDRIWNHLARVILLVYVSGPANPGWTPQEIISQHPRPKHAKNFWSGNKSTAEAGEKSVSDKTEVVPAPRTGLTSQA